jgi:hypothetical protein
VGANKSRKQKKKIRQGFCVERDDNVTNDSVTTATARWGQDVTSPLLTAMRNLGVDHDFNVEEVFDQVSCPGFGI